MVVAHPLVSSILRITRFAWRIKYALGCVKLSGEMFDLTQVLFIKVRAISQTLFVRTYGVVVQLDGHRPTKPGRKTMQVRVLSTPLTQGKAPGATWVHTPWSNDKEGSIPSPATIFK